MPDSTKTFKDVFTSAPEFQKIRETINNVNVVVDFEKIFPELNKVAFATKVVKSTLYLSVTNGAWRQELKFQEKNIIDKINNYYNEIRIRKIKLTL